MINVTINNKMKLNNKMIIIIATACKIGAEPSLRSPAAGDGFCDTVYLTNPCTAIKITKETAKHFFFR
jgi:hypothetical protein